MIPQFLDEEGCDDPKAAQYYVQCGGDNYDESQSNIKNKDEVGMAGSKVHEQDL